MPEVCKPDLEALCRKWQKILRLEDWDVKIAYARAFDMPEPDIYGTCGCSLQHKTATIQIIDPTDAKPGGYWPYTDGEIEETVIHELLHIHLRPFARPKDDPLKFTEEQAINSIATGLVRIQRERERLAHAAVPADVEDWALENHQPQLESWPPKKKP